MDTEHRAVAVIVSGNTLNTVYPALLLALGARREGWPALLFFTFQGLDVINRRRMQDLAFQGSVEENTRLRERMQRQGIPNLEEFLEIIAEAGVEMYACRLGVELFRIPVDDLLPGARKLITVGEFYEKCPTARIIFT